MVIHIQTKDIPLLQKLFSKKPFKKNVSSVSDLNNFIQTYPNDLLKPSLYRLLQTYQNYRPINGDGNCFYRAVMFLYLKFGDLSNFQTLFQPIDLLQCKKLPFQVDNTITSEKILKYLWEIKLQPLSTLTPEEREQELQELLNKSLVADAALIAYFRMLNYSYLANKIDEIQPFIVGEVADQLQRVKTFGQQSQGVQLISLAKILDRKIEIVMVHPENIELIKLNKADGDIFRLFYRPGHYDIIIHPQQSLEFSSFIEPQKLTFTQFFKKHYEQPQVQDSKIISDSKLSSIPRVIQVSTLEEIRFLNTSLKSKDDMSGKNIISFKQFKKMTKIVGVNQDRSQETLQQSSIKPTQQPVPVVTQVIDIKSEYFENKQKNRIKEMIKQSAVLLGGLALIAFGSTAI